MCERLSLDKITPIGLFVEEESEMNGPLVYMKFILYVVPEFKPFLF